MRRRFKPTFQRDTLLFNTLGLHLLHECTNALREMARSKVRHTAFTQASIIIYTTGHSGIASDAPHSYLGTQGKQHRYPVTAYTMQSTQVQGINSSRRQSRERGGIHALRAPGKAGWALQGRPGSGSAGMHSGRALDSCAEFTGVQQVRCSCATGFMSSANVAVACSVPSSSHAGCGASWRPQLARDRASDPTGQAPQRPPAQSPAPRR